MRRKIKQSLYSSEKHIIRMPQIAGKTPQSWLNKLTTTVPGPYVGCRFISWISFALQRRCKFQNRHNADLCLWFQIFFFQTSSGKNSWEWFNCYLALFVTQMKDVFLAVCFFCKIHTTESVLRLHHPCMVFPKFALHELQCSLCLQEAQFWFHSYRFHQLVVTNTSFPWHFISC